VSSPPKKAYLKLDLSEQGLTGLSAVELGDTYCSNPDCSCGGAVLYPIRLAGSGLDRWIELAKEIQFIVDVQTGEIEAKGPVSPLRQALRDGLHQRLDKRRLTQLRKRRLEVLRQHCEEGWKYRDWSDFEPGFMMGWVNLFPESLAPSIRTPHGTYFLDDYYCCTFGCDCTEVQLAILRLDSASQLLGSATLDTRSNCVTFEAEPGLPLKVLQEVFDGFFEQHPDLRAELRRRGEFMAGPVATYVNESVAPRPSRKRSPKRRSRLVAPPPEVVDKVAAIPVTKVGRNETCPCGSGRKYKRCCLAL
jgi:hypothetical protein